MVWTFATAVAFLIHNESRVFATLGARITAADDQAELLQLDGDLAQ
jgi:hypothetical protein